MPDISPIAISLILENEEKVSVGLRNVALAAEAIGKPVKDAAARLKELEEAGLDADQALKVIAKDTSDAEKALIAMHTASGKLAQSQKDLTDAQLKLNAAIKAWEDDQKAAAQAGAASAWSPQIAAVQKYRQQIQDATADDRKFDNAQKAAITGGAASAWSPAISAVQQYRMAMQDATADARRFDDAQKTAISAGAASAWSPAIGAVQSYKYALQQADDVIQQQRAHIQLLRADAQQLGMIGNALTIAGAAGVELERQFADAQQEVGGVEKRLEGVLAAQGRLNDLKAFKGAADDVAEKGHLGSVTGAEKAATELARAGVPVREIDRLMQDLGRTAESTGGSIDGTGKALERALASGRTDRLRTVGINLSYAQQEAIKAAAAHGALAEKLEIIRQVEETVESNTGQLGSSFTEVGAATKDLATEWQKFENSTFGQALVSALTDTEKLLTEILKDLESLSTEHPTIAKFAGTFLGWIAPLAGVAGGVFKIAQYWKAAQAALEAYKVAQKVAGAATAADTVAGAAGAGGAAAAGGSGLTLAGLAALGGTTIAEAGAGAIAGTTAIGAAGGVVLGAGLYKGGQALGLIDRDQSFSDRMSRGWGHLRDDLTGNHGHYEAMEAQQHAQTVAAQAEKHDASKGSVDTDGDSIGDDDTKETAAARSKSQKQAARDAIKAAHESDREADAERLAGAKERGQSDEQAARSIIEQMYDANKQIIREREDAVESEIRQYDDAHKKVNDGDLNNFQTIHALLKAGFNYGQIETAHKVEEAAKKAARAEGNVDQEEKTRHDQDARKALDRWKEDQSERESRAEQDVRGGSRASAAALIADAQSQSSNPLTRIKGRAGEAIAALRGQDTGAAPYTGSGGAGASDSNSGPYSVPLRMTGERDLGNGKMVIQVIGELIVDAGASIRNGIRSSQAQGSRRMGIMPGAD